MKKLLLILSIVFYLSSCETDLFCPTGTGTLVAENTSLNTIQQLIIDDSNYGTLDPGEVKYIELPEGKYTLLFKGISGGGGCRSGQVTIGCNLNVFMNCSG